MDYDAETTTPDHDEQEPASAPTVDAVLDAQQTNQQALDAAVNSQAPATAPSFEDHMEAFGAVLNGIVDAKQTSGSFAGRWDPTDAGSIARRDYYELGIQNPNQFDSPTLKANATALRGIFGNTPEESLIQNDVFGGGPDAIARGEVAAKGSAFLRGDIRFNNFPQARAMVKPILKSPGQLGPGNTTNVAKATPATMPTSFQNQFPKFPKL